MVNDGTWVGRGCEEGGGLKCWRALLKADLMLSSTDSKKSSGSPSKDKADFIKCFISGVSIYRPGVVSLFT
jgi:hypothetical protein